MADHIVVKSSRGRFLSVHLEKPDVSVELHAHDFTVDISRFVSL
jgi:hypothetical protein